MRKPTTILIVAAVLAIHTWAWIGFHGARPEIDQENGWMENYQAVGLVISVVLWLVAAARGMTRAQAIFAASLALLSASLLVLEVDVRNMDTPVLKRIMNGRIRDIWLGSLWVAAAVFFVKNRRSVLECFLTWIGTFSGRAMIVAGAFWVAAALVDKGFLGAKTLFREELMEVNAAVCMVASVVAGLRLARARSGDLQESKPAVPSVRS